MIAGYIEDLKDKRIILGSNSGPRKNLLISSGLENFEVKVSGFEEDLVKSSFASPSEYVKETCRGMFR